MVRRSVERPSRAISGTATPRRCARSSSAAAATRSAATSPVFSFGANGVFDLARLQPDFWAALAARDPALPGWLSFGEVARPRKAATITSARASRVCRRDHLFLAAALVYFLYVGLAQPAATRGRMAHGEIAPGRQNGG